MFISYIINNDVIALPTFNSLWKVLLGYATVRCTLASIIISVMGGSALCNLTCFDFSVEVNTWSVKPEGTAPEAFWSKPLGVRKRWDESKATGARANSTKSDNGRRRRAYKRPELEENLTFNCDRLFTLFTFAPPKLRFFCRLWHLSWLFSKLFYTERAIICKILFDFPLLLCPKLSCSKANDYNIWSDKWWQHHFYHIKRTDRLQLNPD